MENYCSTNVPYIKVVGRNSCSRLSLPVHVERREHADARLLITTHADNKYLFDGKATNKDVFEKIHTPVAEQFTKASVFLVKQRRGACKRMALFPNRNSQNSQ